MNIPPRQDKYGLDAIAVDGDKFVPIPRTIKRNSVMRAIHFHAQRRGKKFICRAITEGGKDGIKIWRTK